jgi:protein-S-isoprenylcysteine O-methyltransferase Ste14
MTARAAVRLVLQVVGVLIMMLAGWGFDDVWGFFAHPARAGVVALAVLGTVVALAWRLDPQPFRPGNRPVGRQAWFLVGVVGGFLFLMWFLPYADRRKILTFSSADWIRYLGLLVLPVGDAVGLVAFRTLGKQYSAYVTLQEAHELVTTGIYGVIRHPIYVRGLLLSVGLPLVFRSWLVVPMPPIVAAALAVRIRQEEELLADQFGAAYAAYKRSSWRLVPYLY